MNTRDGDSRSRQVFTAATAAIVLSLIWVATLRGQGSPATRAPMAEDVFKNVQVLKGIPVDQFMGTELAFPTRITQMLMQVRVGFPTSINDRNVQVIQGTTDGGTLVTMYFDTETGLLTRLMRYAESPVGRIVTQYDYEDYRPVAGVKIPFTWTRTWLDGRSVFQLSDVQPNVTIPPDRFAPPSLRR